MIDPADVFLSCGLSYILDPSSLLITPNLKLKIRGILNFNCLAGELVISP